MEKFIKNTSLLNLQQMKQTLFEVAVRDARKNPKQYKDSKLEDDLNDIFRVLEETDSLHKRQKE